MIEQAATLDTYSKGSFPPIPDVIKTPRSGIALTHRVGLQLESGLAPEDPENTTPRSKGEPAINNWLSNILPAMDDIVCVVEFYDHSRDSMRSELVSMEDLGLLPIDIVYMAQMESEKAMTVLDDAIILYAIQEFAPRADVKIEIKYTQKAEGGGGKLTLFELAPLLNSLRTLIQHSRPLTERDIKLPVEGKKANEADVSLNPQKITLVRDALDGLNTQLGTFIGTISIVVEAKDLADIILNIDNYINNVAMLFKEISLFGLPQTGIGILLEWKRQHFELLRNKIGELIARWENKLTEFDSLIPITMPCQEPRPMKKGLICYKKQNSKYLARGPCRYLVRLMTTKMILVNNKRVAFQAKLDDIKDVLSSVTLSDLYTNIESVIVDIPTLI